MSNIYFLSFELCIKEAGAPQCSNLSFSFAISLTLCLVEGFGEEFEKGKGKDM